MKKVLVAAGIIIIALFTGCTAKNTPETTTAITTEASTDTTTTAITTEASTATTAVPTTDTTTTAMATKPTPKKENIKGVRRAMLSKKLCKLYDGMYQKILRYEEFTIDTTADYSADEVYEVMDALREDYPEFWLYLSSYEGEDSQYDEETGEPIAINSIRIAYEYTWIIRNEFSSKEMEKVLSQIDKVCDEIISKMPANGTLEEKYLFLAKEIADRTVYVSDRNFESISDVDWSYCYMNGPFLAGEGLCQGYAMAYQYLCNRAGLWCICISGQGGGESHSWNLVKTSKGTFHVDVTWCDSEDGFDNYFMVSQEEILIDHTPDEGEPVATGK